MVLREFGEYFFEFCKRSGYDHMLRTLGGNLYEFIENLDALHSYLSLSYQASSSSNYQAGMRGLCQSSQHKEQHLIGVNKSWNKML